MYTSSAANGVRQEQAELPMTAAETVASRAVNVGRVTGKAGMKLAKPLVTSLRREEPKTLAKMVLAAIAPKLVEGAIRFAVRHPGTTVVGLITITGMLLVKAEPPPCPPPR